MNIMLLTTTLNKGGAERVAVSLANELVKFNQVVITKFSDDQPKYHVSEKVAIESVCVKQGNLLYKTKQRIKLIQSIVKKYKIDVVITFSMQLSMYPILAKRGSSVKVIACEHSNPYYRRRSKATKLLMSLLLPHADGYVFLTEEERDYYGTKIASKSAIIPNPLTEIGLPERVIEFESRNQYKICAVGSLRPVKDHETMLRAFSIVNKAIPMAVLHIFGEGEEKDKLMELCSSLNIKDKVVFEGVVDDIYAAIEDSRVFVQTSVSESWGCALQEALACGIPCVSTDCDFGPRKMIKNGENGFLTEIKDPESVAEKIITLLNDIELARYISENALKSRYEYSIEMIAQRYEEYLQQVMLD